MFPPALRAIAAIAIIMSWGGSGWAEEHPGLFWERCGACHDRAGPLLRDHVRVVDDALVGRDSGIDLRIFMRDHRGAPSEREIAILYAALERVSRGQGRFRERCGFCHESAERLARIKLIEVDGILTGRYTGRDIARFLRGHGARSREEAAFFTKVLRRALQ